jgi:hypothetical protein
MNEVLAILTVTQEQNNHQDQRGTSVKMSGRLSEEPGSELFGA